MNPSWMVKFRYGYLLLVLLWLWLPAGARAQETACDFLPQRPEPAWVTQYVEVDGAHVGVGSSQRQSDPGSMLRLSRQSAIAALAQSIEVEVADTLTNTETLVTGADGSNREQQVESITRTTSNLVLQEVTVADTWLDHASCTLWTRVRIDRDKVTTLQERALLQARLDQLKENLDAARDERQSLPQRFTSLEFARLNLARIDFDAIGDVAAGQAWRRQLNALEQELVAAERLQQQIGELRQRAETLIASGTRSGLDEAQSLLREILATRPVGSPGGDAGEFATVRLAEIALAQNNPCLALSYYDAITLRSTSADWVRRAEDAGQAIDCTGKERVTYLWRREFDGRQVAVACAYVDGAETYAWAKPCDEVSNLLRGYGAVVTTNPMAAGATVAAAKTGPKLSDDYSHVILMVAEGEIIERENQRNPMGSDHRFSGSIHTQVVSTDAANVNESYSGMGGWNPVSGDMAMEVLGIHVSKRFTTLLEKQLDNL